MASIPAYGYGSGANNPTLITRASESATASAAVASGIAAAPQNAASATKTSTVNIGTGLATALTLYSQQLANQNGGIADEYVIRFADPMIATAKMIPPGPIDKAFTGAAGTNSAAAQKDPNRQSAPLNVRTKGATAGKQIIQFIDEVIRSSSYLSDQQLYIWNNKTEQFDPSPTRSAQSFGWFNIICTADPLDYDEKRNDFAYRMTYTIVPYETQVLSEYFTKGRFRGAHKIYNYWFTGQNNSIENFSQTFNNQWTQSYTGVTKKLAPNYNTNLYVAKKQYMQASNQNRQGGPNKTFEPAANAADSLYTTDSLKIKLDILGDPAWLPSADSIKAVLTGLQSVYANPFNPDGSINTAASVPYFTFAWNQPVDYNLDTGLMDTGANNFNADRANGKAGDAQESVTYICFKSRSRFNRGKFTQELEGYALDLGPGDAAPTTIATGGLTSADRAAIFGGDYNGTGATADSGRYTDPSVATALVNTVAVRASSTTSRLFDAGVIPSTVNSSNPLQAGVNTLKNYASATLTNIGSNLLRPYEQKLNDTVNSYAKAAGTWLQDSITSISTPKPRPAIPPESIVAAVGQTNEFGGLEAPPTLAVKPGENGLGGYSYDSYAQQQPGFVVADTGQLPQQGIVDDDQGLA
jgi:hypothetical protein